MPLVVPPQPRVLTARQRNAGVHERDLADLRSARQAADVARAGGGRAVTVALAELKAAGKHPSIDADQPRPAVVRLRGGPRLDRIGASVHDASSENRTRAADCTSAPPACSPSTWSRTAAAGLTVRIANARVGRGAVGPRRRSRRRRASCPRRRSTGPSTTSDGRSTPPSGFRQHVSLDMSHLNPSGQDFPDARVQVALESAVLDVGLVATELRRTRQNRKRERPTDSQARAQGRPRRRFHDA